MRFCCLIEYCCPHAHNPDWLTATCPTRLSSDIIFSGKLSEPHDLVSYCLFAPDALVLTRILTFITTSCDGHIFVSSLPRSWKAALWLIYSVSQYLQCLAQSLVHSSQSINTSLPCFIGLLFIVLPRCCIFYKLNLFPSAKELQLALWQL